MSAFTLPTSQTLSCTERLACFTVNALSRWSSGYGDGDTWVRILALPLAGPSPWARYLTAVAISGPVHNEGKRLPPMLIQLLRRLNEIIFQCLWHVGAKYVFCFFLQMNQAYVLIVP